MLAPLRGLLHGLGAPRRNQPVAAPPPARVTFIRTDRFGDHMLFGGFLELLREAWPRARFALVLPEARAPLYEHCPIVDELICFDEAALDSRKARADLYRRVAASRPDFLVNSQCLPSETAERIIRYCPARVRLGVTVRGPGIDAKRRRRYDRFYTHLADLGEFQPWRSERLLHRDLLALLGVAHRDVLPRIWTSPDDVACAEKIYAESGFRPDETLVFFCGSSHKLRSYPPLRQLMTQILDQGPWKILALGGRDEFPQGEPPDETLRPRWRNLCGLSTIRQSAELMRRARLVLGVESGLAQAAAAVGTPHVIVQSGAYFGRFLPISNATSVVIRPLSCYFCTEQCPYPEAYCMTRVAPRVFQRAVHDALAGPSARARIYLEKQAAGPGEPRLVAFDPAWIDPALAEIIAV